MRGLEDKNKEIGEKYDKTSERRRLLNHKEKEYEFTGRTKKEFRGQEEKRYFPGKGATSEGAV